MSEYTQMDILDRKELLSKIATIAHASDEFLQKLKELVNKYEDTTNAKVGFNHLIQE